MQTRREVEELDIMEQWGTAPADSSDKRCRGQLRMARRGYFDVAENAQASAAISPTAPSTLREAERLDRMLDEEA